MNQRNYQKTNQNISLKTGFMIVTNPQYISHQFNAFFIENADRLVNQNKDSKFGHTVNNRILNCSSMFLIPIAEEEVLNVTSK
jgi:hypothetical protein